MNTPEQFPRCPRCQREWQEEEKSRLSLKSPHLPGRLKCCDCGMKYVFSGQHFFTIIMSGEYKLTWKVNDRECDYGTFDDAMNDTLTKLPWLPYDIDLDTLKLYLTFS